MRFPRTFVWLLSALLVGVMFFAQAAFATRPCLDAGMSASAAMLQHDADDCCDTSASMTNLCVAQCVDGDKVSGHAEIPIPLRSDEPVLTVDLPRTASPAPLLWIAGSGLDPPKTIRFCSFLI
jgi:hypothetical protein